MGHYYSGKIVTDGLLLCLDSANPRSYSDPDSNWRNLVPGASASLLGPPTFLSENEGVISFEGFGDHGLIPHALLNLDLTNFSIENWFNRSIYHAGYDSGHVTKWNTGAGDLNSFSLGVGGISGPSPFQFTVQDPIGVGSATSTSIATSINYEINTWYHEVATFSAGNMKIFVNGQLGNEVESGYAQAKEYDVDLKIASFGTGYYATVKIPIVKIYSGKVLSESEVLQNYNTLKGRFGL